MTKQSEAWEAFLGSFKSTEHDLAKRSKEILRTELGSTYRDQEAVAPMVTKKIELDKPGQRVVEITPALASGWLQLNKKNRRIKDTRVAQYTRDMQEGNWRFTGEAIKFDDQGNLIDGQNRLTAIVGSGVQVRMLVVTGLESEAQYVMDSGTPRSASDSLALLGFTTPHEISATVRVHYMWKEAQGYRHCMTTANSDSFPTNAEVVEYARTHPDLVAAAKEGKPIARQLRIPSGAVGAAYYEFLKIDPDDAKEFLSRIQEVKTGGKGDPVSTLIKRCSDMTLRRESVRPPTGLYLIIRTWNAVRASEAIEKFNFGSPYRGWATIPDPK